MKFEKFGLHDTLIKGLEDCGFKKTTDIQYKAIRAILTGSDVLAIAPTGTGKTAAYVIPTLERLINPNKNKTQVPKALVLVPTRELAIQVCDVFNEIGKYTNLKALALYGGTDQDAQIEKLSQGVSITVCTPGRLFDLKSQGYLSLDQISILILDEADQMLKLGFYKDVTDLLKHIPKRRQTLFFSATIDPVIKKLAYSLVNKPIRIELSPQNPISKNISHCQISVSMDDKRFFLERLIKENEGSRIIIFVRTKVRAERVAAAMIRVGIECLLIHGGKEQKDRELAISSFKKGQKRLLIATDVSARGIDIPSVDIVVNYDVPDVAENYVHRIGRTGRGVAKGIAYTFVSPDEKDLIADIEEYTTVHIPIINLDTQTYEEIKKIADPNSITISQVEDLINQIESNYNSWENDRKKQKKNNH